MRSFEQRIAEINRRSEKIFRERKQRRKHILMACIPLVLCITLFSAFILPAMMPTGSTDPDATDAAMGGLTESRNESLICSVAKIEVSGFGLSLLHTEVSDIQRISDQLNSYTVIAPESNGSANEEPRGEDFKENADDGDISGSIANSATTGYTITLVMREGSNTEYYLAGNTLKNLTTNQTYTLTQSQVNELNDLLGIPNQ